MLTIDREATRLQSSTQLNFHHTFGDQIPAMELNQNEDIYRKKLDWSTVKQEDTQAEKLKHN